MYLFSDHFLDANILIGSLIDWDVQHRCTTNYMNRKELKRHTSKRVYREAKGVLEKMRRTIPKFLDKFYDDLNKREGSHNVLTNVDYQKMIDKSSNDFIKKERLNDKERNAIKSFVWMNFLDLQKVALGGENKFGEFKKDIIDIFKRALNTLDKKCQTRDKELIICRYDECPESYKDDYPNERSDLNSLINYKNDVLVLLDSYYIKNHWVQNDVCFITTDKEHILSSADGIEKILCGIYIAEPQ